MNEAGIDTEIQVERLFVICLQKALDKHAPEQLEELSQWFDPGSRQMRFHIAPVIGAVGYLRKHTTVYQEIMRSAGIEASAKAYTGISQIDMLAIKLFPRFGRERLLKRLLQSGLRRIHREAYVLIQKEDGKFIVTLSNSIFCMTSANKDNGYRCQFYAALFVGLLGKTDLFSPLVSEVSCRGRGEEECRFEVDALHVPD